VRQRAEGDSEGLVGVRNEPLVRGESKYAIKDIGTYLNRWAGFQLWKGQAIGTRFALIHDRLQDIAAGMKV
jgi:hypothetical protein